MDFPIGTPYNVAQYAMLLMMIAQVTDMQADELIITGGDCHIYTNQMLQVAEQLGRVPYKKPTLSINPGVTDIDAFTLEDFELCNYEHHAFIKYPVAT
jgi:thymidylate synthase